MMGAASLALYQNPSDRYMLQVASLQRVSFRMCIMNVRMHAFLCVCLCRCICVFICVRSCSDLFLFFPVPVCVCLRVTCFLCVV